MWLKTSMIKLRNWISYLLTTTMMTRTGNNSPSVWFPTFRILFTTQFSPGMTGGYRKMLWATQQLGIHKITQSIWSGPKSATYTKPWPRLECSRRSSPNRVRTAEQQTKTGTFSTPWRESSVSQLSSLVTSRLWLVMETYQPRPPQLTCEEHDWESMCGLWNEWWKQDVIRPTTHKVNYLSIRSIKQFTRTLFDFD